MRTCFPASCFLVKRRLLVLQGEWEQRGDARETLLLSKAAEPWAEGGGRAGGWGRGSHRKQRLKRTCLDNLRWGWLAGGPGEYHLLGVHQKTAVACNQAGEVGGFRPLHQQYQRLEGKRSKAHEGHMAQPTWDQSSKGVALGPCTGVTCELAGTFSTLTRKTSQVHILAPDHLTNRCAQESALLQL